ncbi:hypothetical protein [Zunongwangia sp. H14]|uniref:hypothetical protein n=1 Tax=Zunongwangia sp. H14 TaxID=3240792 RepID=UPI0035634EAF
MGNKWEDVAVKGTTFSCLNDDSIQTFIVKAIEKDRIPLNTLNIGKETLFKNLSLLTEQGQLTNAAVLLFRKKIN